MRLHGHLLATTRRWTGDDGKERKQRVRVGSLYCDDRGGAMSIRLDAVPTSRDWSGWLKVEPVDERPGGSREAGAAPDPYDEADR